MKYEDKGYIDLDKEVVLLPDGTRLTEDVAAKLGKEIADRAWERRRGRPSLSGEAAESPQIAVRVTVDIRKRLEDRAKREGKTLSQVAREALENYA